MDEMDLKAYEMIREYALRLSKRNYVTAHGGNISIRSGNTVWITRHASSLEDLQPEEVVRLRMDEPVGHDIIASTETPVHLNIYRKTSNLAVVHAHPPYAIVLSFYYDEFIPIDNEAGRVLRKVPVVEGSPGSDMLAENVANALKKYHAVIVRAHGVFTTAKFLDVAYQFMCMVEHGARIFYLTEFFKSTGKKFIAPKYF